MRIGGHAEVNWTLATTPLSENPIRCHESEQHWTDKLGGFNSLAILFTYRLRV